MRNTLLATALQLVIVASAHGQTPATPGVMYASTGFKDGGRLLTIDLSTGAGTLVGSTGLGAAPDIAINSNCELFSLDAPSSNHNLFRLDAASGASLFVGNIGAGLRGLEALAFDANDVLYGTNQFPAVLVRIDAVTGAPTVLGATSPRDFVGLSFDPADGTLYASLGRGDDRIFTIDVTGTPGATTLIGSTGLGVSTPSIAFDSAGILYGVTGGGQSVNNLISIDKSTGAGTVIGPIGFTAVSGLAFCPPENQPVFLVIDEDSIDNGIAPNFFTGAEVNEDIADIGLRATLPFFAANVGATITLHTGEVGDEGWFAVKTVPSSWPEAGPTDDGLCNYLGAGPGLGTPDANGDREALLDKIPDVTPLRATGLKLLEGLQVCALVYDSDVSINYGPLNGSLKGSNLGIVAFEVISVTALSDGESSVLPEVQVRILDAQEICNCAGLTLFADAPEPISSSEPFDVLP